MKGICVVRVIDEMMAEKSLIVRLKNVNTGEYLYAADNTFVKDNKRRPIFTWRDKNTKLGDWTDWKMRGFKDDEGKLKIELIPMKYKNEPLFAAMRVEDIVKKRRSVYTLRPGETNDFPGTEHWTLETNNIDKAKHPNRYILSNAALYEYLYSPEDTHAFDRERRNAFTWAVKNSEKEFAETDTHMWDIEIISDKV